MFATVLNQMDPIDKPEVGSVLLCFTFIHSKHHWLVNVEFSLALPSLLLFIC